MKTLFIDCSPKKKLSASGFIAGFTAAFTRGKKVREKLRNRADHERILEHMEGADSVVFCMPLYVDGVPSHVLPFLKDMENRYKDREEKPAVYVIANNGFIEGRQNETLMQVMENACARMGTEFHGGLGIGGGVMMNVMRILILVYFGLAVLNLVLSAVNEGVFNAGILLEFGKQVLEVLLLGCGIIAYDLWLAHCINRGRAYGKHYTRIMLPSFVFILCADIFFVISSVIDLGIFRGWLSAKKPSGE